MKAISWSRFGPASEVLEFGELPDPEPGAGEVVVRLAFSGVNPSDAKARAGSRPGITRPPFDRIVPHSDGAGVIEAVGSGVDPGRVGQRVWLWNGQWQRPFGTAAERIALPQAQAVPLPEAMTLETGACLGIPGLTAAHCVLGGGAVDGQWVLISGAGGAVGHNAVQLARWAGARVVATASPGGFERVRAAGAERVVDYRDPEAAAQIVDATGGAGIARAVEVEFGRNAAMLAQVTAPLGRVVAYGSGQDMTPVLPFGDYLFKALTLEIVLIYLLPGPAREAAIAALHEAHAAGAFTPAIHAVMPLDAAAEAHDAVMTPGRRGAVLLRCG